MSKKIFVGIAFLAMVMMVSAAFAQQGGFIVDTVQIKDEGKNNGFLDRVDVIVTVSAPETLFVGQNAWFTITLTNTSGRAIPDITAWQSPTFKKFDKNGVGQYDGGYTSGGVILGYDSLGKAITNVSLSDKQSLTVYFPVDTSVAGTLVIDDIEIWTRLGNKNFQDQLYGSLRGDSITIEILDNQPGFPPGIVIDGDGNLVIDVSWLQGCVLPETNGQGWMEVSINNKVISGNGDYNTNSWAIKIKSKALVAGIFVIKAETKIPNQPAVLVFELIFVDGKPVGAVILE